MIWIQHRINKITDLSTVRKTAGVEIDLRSNVTENGSLHLSHDAWAKGDSFEAWLKEFKRLKIGGPIIVNTKEDGLEDRVLVLLKEYGISNFFFLDTALPTLAFRTRNQGEHFFATRISSLEPKEGPLALKGMVDWLWVDCFGGVPLSKNKIEPLKKHFKLCLVSPELQKRPYTVIPEFLEIARLCDAICTKSIESWEGYVQFDTNREIFLT